MHHKPAPLVGCEDGTRWTSFPPVGIHVAADRPVHRHGGEKIASRVTGEHHTERGFRVVFDLKKNFYVKFKREIKTILMML